ncbi:alkaline phosphatase family protein [Andreprevotia chitinilytica]|uniref:alkaline phosphatase family protein n=1 Tax=Andreprevotia chitinilytica TaxID=396808 RepID=UPI0006899DBA|nr:alkaline phosphatase family protein [Andreprevotia chitinilytica]
MHYKTTLIAGLLAVALAGCATEHKTASTTTAPVTATSAVRAERVLLISVDGMHQQDLARFVADHPTSTMAALSRSGITYNGANTPTPSDSFPGLLALIAGGTPASTGVYYDDSYDRNLSPAGSDCSQRGAEVVFDGSINRDEKALDGGGGLDEAKLPRNPAKGCKPVYPHDFLRVNTVFEVVKDAGGLTAWSDKHLAYDFVKGPSGNGVDDPYNLEISAMGETLSIFPGYDDLKAQAVINQINGFDSSGTRPFGTPVLFGLNYQNLSVAQKSGDGYKDANGTPGMAIAESLSAIDQSLGRIVSALKARNLYSSTLIVLTAKHGQAPIDKTKLSKIAGKQLLARIESVVPGGIAKETLDDVGLIWLKDQSKAAAVAEAIQAKADELGVQKVYSGMDLPAGFASAAHDSRAPDLVIQVKPGVIYTSGKKIAEHGGFGEEDRHVALLLSKPGLQQAAIDAPVSTTQVAPTLLKVLGLKPEALQAVQKEHTMLLPGV